MAPSPPRYRCVLFDLDGTLLDTHAGMLHALSELLAELGLTPPAKTTPSPARHYGLDAMLAQALQAHGMILGAEQLRAAQLRLKTRYLEAAAQRVRPYPGSLALLQRLHGHGVWLGLCSNQAESSARELLARFGMTGYFRAVVGGDSLPASKPDPLPLHWLMDQAGASVTDTLMVGDSTVDALSARNAGTDLVLLDHDESLPADAAGTLHLHSFAALERYLFPDP